MDTQVFALYPSYEIYIGIKAAAPSLVLSNPYLIHAPSLTTTPTDPPTVSPKATSCTAFGRSLNSPYPVIGPPISLPAVRLRIWVILLEFYEGRRMIPSRCHQDFRTLGLCSDQELDALESRVTEKVGTSSS